MSQAQQHQVKHHHKHSITKLNITVMVVPSYTLPQTQYRQVQHYHRPAVSSCMICSPWQFFSVDYKTYSSALYCFAQLLVMSILDPNIFVIFLFSISFACVRPLRWEIKFQTHKIIPPALIPRSCILPKQSIWFIWFPQQTAGMTLNSISRLVL